MSNGKTATTPSSAPASQTLWDQIVCNPVYQVVSFIPTLGTSPLICRASRAAGEAYNEYAELQDAEHAALVAGAQAVEAGHEADAAGYQVATAAAETERARQEAAQQTVAAQAALSAIAPVALVGGLFTLGVIGYLLWRRKQPQYAATYLAASGRSQVAGGLSGPPAGLIGDIGDFEGAGYSVRRNAGWTKHGPDQDGFIYYEWERKIPGGGFAVLAVEGCFPRTGHGTWRWSVCQGGIKEPYQGPVVAAGKATSVEKAKKEAVRAFKRIRVG